MAQLAVFWPQSGEEQVFDEVPLNAIIRVIEGRDQLEILALPPFKFNVKNQNGPSTINITDVTHRR